MKISILNHLRMFRMKYSNAEHKNILEATQRTFPFVRLFYNPIDPVYDVITASVIFCVGLIIICAGSALLLERQDVDGRLHQSAGSFRDSWASARGGRGGGGRSPPLEFRTRCISDGLLLQKDIIYTIYLLF